MRPFVPRVKLIDPSAAGPLYSELHASKSVFGGLRRAVESGSVPSSKPPHRLCALASLLVLSGCVSPPQPPSISPAEGRALIDRSLPRDLADRAGWVNDLYGAFRALQLPPTRENVCAVVAVTAQESGFRVDPVVPDLGAIAWREIERRAEHAGIPVGLVHEVLKLDSPNGQSYGDRIEHARTEKELSDIFEDFTGSLPLGRTLFASWNPIRTRGPMQVNVAFADQFASAHRYPYRVKVSIDEELFSRRGSLYFGTAHLLDYDAPYDRYLYRFADFNAGQYSSRNAAFQQALGTASGRKLTADGALLPHDPEKSPGDTELAARSIAARLQLDDGAIHAALEEGRSATFERSSLYRGVFRLAEQIAGHSFPRAAMPEIELVGPKIERRLTTEWYAHRVDGRFQACLAR